MQEEIEMELLSILDVFAKELPDADVHNIKELYLVGEYSVGLENLCSQLYEYEIKITPILFERLQAIGKTLQVKDDTINILQELVQKASE